MSDIYRGMSLMNHSSKWSIRACRKRCRRSRTCVSGEWSSMSWAATSPRATTSFATSDRETVMESRASRVRFRSSSFSIKSVSRFAVIGFRSDMAGQRNRSIKRVHKQ